MLSSMKLDLLKLVPRRWQNSSKLGLEERIRLFDKLNGLMDNTKPFSL